MCGEFNHKMNSLIGIWDSSEGLGIESPTWEVLVFNGDGTGRVEAFNWSLNWYETFAWKLLDDKTLYLRGQLLFEYNPNCASGHSIDQSDFDILIIEFSIQKKELIDFTRNDVLVFNRKVFYSECYGRSRHWSLATYPPPEFSKPG